uniref:Uncharacterized protein n=1 Tax=Timema bartmani TaxID=61472 RepID=A0A7R9F8B1_9NEOP|nr:unnamed protein product [Timema bartmani]
MLCIERGGKLEDQDFGVVVMSDLTLETRPCFSSGQGEVDADRARSPDVRMHVMPGRVNRRRGGVNNRARSMVAMSPLAYPLTVGVPTSPRGYSEDARQPSIEVRTFFPETWLWELIHIGSERSEHPSVTRSFRHQHRVSLVVYPLMYMREPFPSSSVRPKLQTKRHVLVGRGEKKKEGETVLKRDLPHTITDWVGSTVCVSAQHGLGVSSPARVRAFQPFFLDYVMPYSIKRGEVVHLKVSLYNFLAHSLPVRINLEDSPGITLVSDTSTVVSCVQEKTTLVHKFLIRAAELGEVNVTVTAAVDPEYEEACGPELIIGTRDVLVKSILVKPEGFPVEVTKSSFMCPTEISNDTSMLWSIDLPEDVVKDSARAQISAVADLMGPTLQRWESKAVRACVYNRLRRIYAHGTTHLNILENGSRTYHRYQRELNYRHTDGSYSAFGNSDSSGSMWLTAFVLKSFAQARTHIFVDEDDLKMSMRWITKKQLENGCFPLVGQVFHKDMKGGLTSDTSSAALTAYVLISLLETGLPLAPSVASNAVFCLRGDKQPDVYTLALTTYAFSLLGNRSLAEESLRHFMGAATIQQDLIWWEKQDTNSLALNIETTAYGILSLVKLGGERNLIDALRAVRWISKHRNANGGFVSTQDTVVALEALTKYAMAVPSRDTHLSVLVAATDLEHVFQIRQHDRLLLKQRWLPTLPTQVEVVAEGEGCALIQSTLKYNVRTPSGSDAFSLEVETGPVASVDECTMQRVEACVSYRLPGQISNMAVLEIAMVTGYKPDRNSLHKLDQDTELDLKRWEEERDQVNFYFEQLTNRKQCVGFLVVQEVEVDNPAPALVRLYDYYQQELVISTGKDDYYHQELVISTVSSQMGSVVRVKIDYYHQELVISTGKDDYYHQELVISMKYSSDIGCKSERLPHPEPGVLNGNMALSQGSKDEELISNTGLTREIAWVAELRLAGTNSQQQTDIKTKEQLANEVVLTIMQADTNDLNTTSESNSTGLNPQFVNVDHELETPSGQEGPEPVYVQPQGDNPQNIADRASTCPQCSNLDQDAFTTVYCNSSTVYKLTIRKGNTARILLKLAPGRPPTRVRRLINLLLGKNCQCAPLAQVSWNVCVLKHYSQVVSSSGCADCIGQQV